MENKEQLIFGIRPLIEAIKAGKEIDKILIKKGLGGELFRELSELIHQQAIPFQYVPMEKLNRITTKNHQGVVSYMSMLEYQEIEKLIPMLYEAGTDPFIMVLDRLTDVRNFGSIARSAECAGVNAIIISENGSARINADAMKTSAGALNIIPVCRIKNINQCIRFLKESGITIVAATEKASENYWDISLKGPLAIVMGSEEDGISEQILKLADSLAKIPVNGKIESLNVSNAAAVLLFESVRQRRLD